MYCYVEYRENATVEAMKGFLYEIIEVLLPYWCVDTRDSI